MTNAEREQMMLLSALLHARFDRFVEYAFRQLFPSETFVAAPHVEALCRALQSVTEGDERRLLVTMAPRQLKSFCAAVALPAHALGTDPTLKIAVVSYNHELSREHAELFRRIVTSDWYQALFPAFRLAERGDRLERFVTTEGGVRRAVSVGGTFTGTGVDLLILDDLIKANDANSAANREFVERFYTDTAVTRFNNPRNSRVISVQQRLHVDDIVSTLIETGLYRHLNLPIIADKDVELPLYEGDVWNWRAGELLSPERFPQEEIDRIQKEMGTSSFAAQFLLDPQLAGGSIADWSRIHVVDAPFNNDDVHYVAQSIDTAMKVGDACDYSVITTWGYNQDREIWRLLHILRTRLEYPDLKSTAIALARSRRANKILIEDATFGSALFREMRQAGLNAACIPVRQGKPERFSQALDLLYDGRIELCSSVDDFEEMRREIRGFPSAHYNDIVDSISQFAIWARGARMEQEMARAQGQRLPARARPSRPARRLAGI